LHLGVTDVRYGCKGADGPNREAGSPGLLEALGNYLA
jgi:hypothetical protein